MYRLEHKSIIAMKGHPFTRKTEIAKYIASSLGFPLLSLDDFLTQTPTSLPNPQDLAFGIMCRIAKSNLSKGFVQRIVIDSPLSSRSHLNQLIQLAESTHQTRLVIVECKSDNIYEWQTKLEEYLDQHPPATRSRWWWCEAHKNWDDVEREIRDAYDERSDGYNIPKLLIDPLSLYDGSISYADSSLMSPLLGAVRCMLIVTDVVGPDLVVYDLWRQGHYHTSGWSDVNNKCRGGSHCIEEDHADHGLGLEYESVCSACQKQLVVGAAAYTCKQCSFALHKECAELLDDVVDDSKPSAGSPSTDDLSRLLRKGCRDVYPDLNFRCSWCEEEKETNAESNDSSCRDCLFATHVKSRVMPTAIRHDCHHHVLSAELSDLNPYGKSCNCKACGVLIGECVWYSCKICDIKYHYSCLTQLPLRVEHQHGGHHHHMVMQFSSMEEEDYLCEVCFERELPERRDPSCWFYSCQDCQYVAHLNCVCDGKT